MSTTAPQPQPQPQQLQQPDELSWSQWAVEMAAYLEEVWIAPALRAARRLLAGRGGQRKRRTTSIVESLDPRRMLRDASIRLRDRLRPGVPAEPLCDADDAVDPREDRERGGLPAFRVALRNPVAPARHAPRPEQPLTEPVASPGPTRSEPTRCEALEPTVDEPAAHEQRPRITARARAAWLVIKDHKAQAFTAVFVAVFVGGMVCGVPVRETLGLVLLGTLFVAPALYILRLIAEMTGLVKDPDEWHDWKQDLTGKPATPQTDGRPNPDLESILDREPIPRRNRLAQAYRYPRQKLLRR